RACSACHQLEGVGSQIGAELNAIGNQGSETILLNILDPNREVKPQYLGYVLVTGTGRIVTGMITTETANALTLRRADGTSETGSHAGQHDQASGGGRRSRGVQTDRVLTDASDTQDLDGSASRDRVALPARQCLPLNEAHCAVTATTAVASSSPPPARASNTI